MNAIPIRTGKKVPAVEGWPDRFFAESELVRLFDRDPTLNVGIVCGSTSGNLLVLDFDDTSAFRETPASFQKEIVPATWTVSTRRGLHVYVRTPEPVKTGKRMAGRLDIKGERSLVVAPKSRLYVNGQLELSYAFQNRTAQVLDLPLDALDFFELKTANAVGSDGRLPDVRPYGIPWKFWDMLRFGHYEAHGFQKGLAGRSRSEADAETILYLVNLGWSVDQVLDLYRCHAHPNTHYRDPLKCSDGPAYVRHTYAKEKAFHAATLSDEKRQLARLRSWALARHWPGRTGLTDRDVLLSVLDIGTRTNQTEFDAASREVAELAGVGRDTATKSLWRLSAQGILYRAQKATHIRGARWAVPKSDILSESVSPDEGMSEDGTTRLLKPAAEAFSHKALGKTGQDVFRAILAHPGLSMKALASCVSVSRRTLYRKVGRFLELRIVTRRKGRIYPTDVPADELARRVRALGTNQKKREKHRDERRRHRKKIDDWLDEKRLGTVDPETGEILPERFTSTNKRNMGGLTNDRTI